MCKRCEGEFVIAELPPPPIPKGFPCPGLLAQVLTSKYADHAPLNRQFGIFYRHNVDLAVSTMCDWVRDMADLLSPIVIEVKRQILQSHRINADDTSVLVQNLSGQVCSLHFSLHGQLLRITRYHPPAFWAPFRNTS